VRDSLKSRKFGTLPHGQSVEAWTLRGSAGLEIEAITYGGVVTRLLAPDREGGLTDVVLGFSALEDYLSGNAYFGAIIGRVAGRIADAKVLLDGKTYNLLRNDPPNHLHGGLRGFDKKVWKASPVKKLDGAPSLRLSACSLDGDEGYPGTVQVDVTYTITNQNVFLIETSAVADHSTPLSLTHHSYFNLAGEAAGTVEEHDLQVHADEFVPVNAYLTPLGKLKSVTGESNDFRVSRRLGPAIPGLFQRHGDIYRLLRSPVNRQMSRLAPAARLIHPQSGRVLEVSTTEAYMQIYTASALDGSLIGKSGVPYCAHAGICFECQGYPDGANVLQMGDIFLRPGERRSQSTVYAFSTGA